MYGSPTGMNQNMDPSDPEAGGARDVLLDLAITGLKAMFADPGGYTLHGSSRSDQWRELRVRSPGHGEKNLEPGSVRQYFDERWAKVPPPDNETVEEWREFAEGEGNNVPLRLFVGTMDAVRGIRRELTTHPDQDPTIQLPACLQFPEGNRGLNEKVPEPDYIAFLRDFVSESLGRGRDPDSRFRSILDSLTNYRNQGDLVRFSTNPAERLTPGQEYDVQLPILEAFRTIAMEDLDRLGGEYLDGYDALFDVEGEDFAQQQQRMLKRKVFIETAGKYSLRHLEAYEETHKPLIEEIKRTRRWFLNLLNESVAEPVLEITHVPNRRRGSMDTSRLHQTVINIRAEEPNALVRVTREEVIHHREEILGRRDFIVSLDVSGSVGTTTKDSEPKSYQKLKDRFRFKPAERLVDWLEGLKRQKRADEVPESERPPDPSDQVPAAIARRATITFTETIAQVQPAITRFEQEHGVPKGTLAMKTMLIGFGFSGTPRQDAVRKRTPSQFFYDSFNLFNYWLADGRGDEPDQKTVDRYVKETFESLYQEPYTEDYYRELVEGGLGLARIVKPIGAELTTLDKLELHNMWEQNSGAGWGTPAGKAMEIALEQAKASVKQKRKPVYTHITDGVSGTPEHDQEVLQELRKTRANVRCIVIPDKSDPSISRLAPEDRVTTLKAIAARSGFREEEITVLEDVSELSEALKDIQRKEMHSAVSDVFGIPAST